MIQAFSEWVRELLSGPGGERVPEDHPALPAVEVELDRPRTLRWTNREAREFKRRTGIDAWRDGLNLNDMAVEDYMELLAVACQQDDPEITAEQLDEHLYGQRHLTVFAAMNVLLNRWSPPLPEGADENPLIASALSHLTRMQTGRSPRKPSASPTNSTGGSVPA